MANIIDIFKITAFLDEARWSSIDNYSTIDYDCCNLSGEKKLLVHYLLYVMDRQMPYERIWSLGGRIFSHIVNDYITNGTSTFVWSKDSNSTAHVQTAGESIKFYAKTSKGDEYFQSRFVSTDYKSIYTTLYILEHVSNKNLVDFLKKVADRYKENKDEIIYRLAFALYLLTYECKQRKHKEKLEDYLKTLNGEAEKQRVKVQKYLSNDTADVDNDYKVFCNKQKYYAKRLWCSLRDYLKSPEYNKELRNALDGILTYNIEDCFTQLELPGDVWNNNNNFTECLFANTESEGRPKSWCLNKHLREKFNAPDSGITVGYPEQFDVTFSLAPMMCSKLDCEYCPYGILLFHKIDGKSIKHHFNELCADNPQKFCPIVLYSTGYKYRCVGNEKCILCKLWKQRTMNQK